MTAQTFFREINRLIQIQPKLTSHILASENCDLGDQIFYSKDLFYCFDCVKCSNGIFLFDCYMCPQCIDCDYAATSELCYECVDTDNCYNCIFLENCEDMRDSLFCYGCQNCNNCFGCVDLNNKSYCLFNRQLTPDEYPQFVSRFRSLPLNQILQILEELKNKFPRTQTIGKSNVNSAYGNYVYQSKDCYLCFDSSHNTESSYMYDSHRDNNCYDFSYSVDSDLSYEVIDSIHSFNSTYVVYSAECQDSFYMVSCKNMKNCLGCVGLANKQYCILNRQLTKEEYEMVSNQILVELNKQYLGWADINF